MAFDDFEPTGANVPDGDEQNSDLFDFPAVDPIADDDAAAEATPAPVAARPKHDFDLDEDLFGFPVMDGSDSVAPEGVADAAGSVLGELEQDIEQLIDQASELIEEEDLESYIEPEPVVATATPVSTKPASQAAPAPVAAEAAVQTIITPQATAPALHAPLRFGRTGAILGAIAVTFAFALLGVVWNASRGMQEALSARNTDNGADLALQSRIIELEHMLGDQREELLAAVEASVADSNEILPVNIHVEPEWFVERSLIQEAIREGRYVEARKRLFALQAVSDELDVEIRDELSPTIAFLIPETYRLQAQARGGNQ